MQILVHVKCEGEKADDVINFGSFIRGYNVSDGSSNTELYSNGMEVDDVIN